MTAKKPVSSNRKPANQASAMPEGTQNQDQGQIDGLPTGEIQQSTLPLVEGSCNEKTPTAEVKPEVTDDERLQNIEGGMKIINQHLMLLKNAAQMSAQNTTEAISEFEKRLNNVEVKTGVYTMENQTQDQAAVTNADAAVATKKSLLQRAKDNKLTTAAVVIGGTAAVAAVGYGGYKAYQHFTKKDEVLAVEGPQQDAGMSPVSDANLPAAAQY